ncbi:MAG TPA: hydroxymethylbilane synthase [Streptosporangiaceae bacterium]|nr:hydroxymethylbilane synthase [Streptosporangiaceae bacterium]
MSGIPTGARALRLGTRRSPMAMAQSAQVARMLSARTGCLVELVGYTTFGDLSKADLAQIGGTGVFVSELRKRLIDGDIDLAVHSLKDLPAMQDSAQDWAGQDRALQLAAIPPREDPRDALVARGGVKLADLPTAARIGTGSPRRAAQLMLLRPDLRPVPIRGNAGTRIGKIDSGEVDAVVLAYAGLARIGRLEAVSQVFEPDEMMPAPGQGALAAECLASRPELADLLSQIDDEVSRAATSAERNLLAALQGGCSAPIGAYAAGTRVLRLDAVVVAPDGEEALRASASGPASQAAQIGREVAAELLERGAGRYTHVSDGHRTNGDDAK